MSVSRRIFWGALFACAALSADFASAQAPCNCAPPAPYGYGYGPAYGYMGPGSGGGHWIYGQLTPYPAWHYQQYGAYGYGAGTDPRFPRVAGPDAAGRSQINPAIPYRNFEEYLKSQTSTAPTPQTPVGPAPTPLTPIPVPPASKGASATIEIHVPDAKAEVTINDQPTSQTGLIRVFQTPPLQGKQVFRVYAKWGNIVFGESDTRMVEVSPGETKKIEFTEKKKN